MGKWSFKIPDGAVARCGCGATSFEQTGPVDGVARPVRCRACGATGTLVVGDEAGQ